MTLIPALAKLARLMSPDLPQFIEPSLLADAGIRVEGELELSVMERLRNMILEPSGPVDFRMTFRKDRRGLIRATGDYRVKVTLLCQRCLEPMEIVLANPIDIGLVTDEEESDLLPDEIEQVNMEDNQIALLALIEDELLLGMPMSPKHTRESCSATEDVDDRAPEKSSPFAVLKNMK